MFSKKIPFEPIRREGPSPVKVAFIVMDGVGDRPSPGFGNKTPLEAALNPNMNKLARGGLTGIMDTIAPGIRPGSGTGHLALFGYDPTLYNLRRGPFEALGLGLELGLNDVAVRGNFATINEGRVVVDRRAGRIDHEAGALELVEALKSIEIPGVQVEFGYHPRLCHRLVLVLRGPNLSGKISDSDEGVVNSPIRRVRPLDGSGEAKNTARIVNEIIEKSHRVLKDHPINVERKKRGLPPANAVLTRGSGVVKKIQSFSEKYGLTAACIAGGNMYRGIARYLGMKLVDVPGATGLVNTDLKGKVEHAITALKESDFAFLHLKGADLAGEDGDFNLKKRFIEEVDSSLKPLFQLEETLFILTADHSTPVTIKSHSADPVPICINGPEIRFDDVELFDEKSVQRGGLHRIRGLDLMNIIMDLLNLEHKYE